VQKRLLDQIIHSAWQTAALAQSQLRCYSVLQKLRLRFEGVLTPRVKPDTIESKNETAF
jgi:hypothetical protein